MNIERLISLGEGETQDFKQTITSITKIAKTISAFANTKGGKILVGVKDNGAICGVQSDEEKFMLEGAALEKCKPPVKIKFSETNHLGKTVLLAEVEESNQKPHFAKSEDGKWWAYVRSNDQTLVASTVMLEVMKSEKKGREPRVYFGEVEKELLSYLDQNPGITIKEFCKLAKISKWKATKILVNLIRMDVVKVSLGEKSDFYFAEK